MRTVNIKYGEHVPVYESANRKYGSYRNSIRQSGLTSPNVLNTNAAKDIEHRLKQSYVQLGDAELQNAYFNSTQKTFFAEPKGVGEREPVMQNKGKTLAHNFSLGGSNGMFMTMTSNKDTYVHSPKAAQEMQPNTDFVKHLKANHFDIAHDHGNAAANDTKDHFKTLH